MHFEVSVKCEKFQKGRKQEENAHIFECVTSEKSVFQFPRRGIQRKLARVRHDILAQCQINVRSRNITRVINPTHGKTMRHGHERVGSLLKARFH